MSIPGSFASDHFVPGTGYAAGHSPHPAPGGPRLIDRDPRLRQRYLDGLADRIARLLGAIDRNPFRPTYGCLDRQYWHYRTACFPSEMYQEGVLPLALVYTHRLPGNRWQGCRRVRELAVAAMHFAARSCHRDGSCDDYYPFERAFGAAVFSLQAAAGAYALLQLNDPLLLDWFRRRAGWLAGHDESGNLSNHHALAALGLWRLFRLIGDGDLRRAAQERIDRVLAWQDEEGWFDEYGGADPGYQTVTLDCLAKIRRLSGDARLDEPIRRGVEFARHFLHPDGSYGGEYGSRGTGHFYPHGMELLAERAPEAADLADGFLRALAAGRQTCFNDDRLFAHRLGNRIEAYLDWSPRRLEPIDASDSRLVRFARAGLVIRREEGRHTVVSTARGGIFKHFEGPAAAITDAGLILQTEDGTVAVSQMHERDRTVRVSSPDGRQFRVVVAGHLHEAPFETATPLKQSLLHTGMWLVGRWCRTAVRRVLQRRLITGRRPVPIRLTRTIELRDRSPSLQVTDLVELTSPAVRVGRLAFGTDHQSAYVAASGLYQDGVMQSWTDLGEHVERLNRERRVEIVRQFPQDAA